MAKADLTAERVRELITYDPDTGLFTRRVGRKGIAAGTVAGCVTHYGYRTICVDGVDTKAHHLAWFMIHGYWPTYLDHINGDRLDNRIANLREASHQDNMQNLRGPKVGNKSGYLGVTAFGNKWRATITVNRKSIHLGLFDTAEEAHSAYVSEKRKRHQSCTI